MNSENKTYKFQYNFIDAPISGTLKSNAEGQLEAFDYKRRKLKNGLEEDLQKLVKDQKGKFLSYMRLSLKGGQELKDLSLELGLRISNSGNSAKHILLFVSKDNGEFGLDKSH